MGLKGYRMTVSQVRKAIEGKKYILLRDYNGRLYGINTGIAKIKGNADKNGNKKTVFVSYLDCGLMEYITYKIRCL